MTSNDSSTVIQQSTHVLIVDDEAMVCDVLEAFVTNWGFKAKCITNSSDVGDAVVERFYNVVLLDVVMPRKSGIDLIPEITDASPDTKIIMMSGYSEKEHVIEALRLGASDFLEKPIEGEFLFETLKRTLHLQKTELKFQKAHEELKSSREALLANESRLKETNRQLRETNNLLSVLAQNIDRARRETEFQISRQIKTAIMPLIEKFRRSKHLKEFQVDLQVLMDFMDDLLNGLRMEPQIAQVLSATELRVAALIKNGLTTDEIAQHMFVSSCTVKSHRRNIRKKLNLNHSKLSLKGFLQTKFEKQGMNKMEDASEIGI